MCAVLFVDLNWNEIMKFGWLLWKSVLGHVHIYIYSGNKYINYKGKKDLGWWLGLYHESSRFCVYGQGGYIAEQMVFIELLRIKRYCAYTQRYCVYLCLYHSFSIFYHNFCIFCMQFWGFPGQFLLSCSFLWGQM